MKIWSRSTGFAVLFVCFAITYADVCRELVYDWAHDGNYSHGFFIAPLAVYLAWERRRAFRAAPKDPRTIGMFIVAGSLCLLLAGTLGAEYFVSRVSMIGALAGGTVWLWGWRHLRILAFPLAFLLLMIPIPDLLFNQVAFPLQLVASRLGEALIAACQVPVLREGNLIAVPGVTLEVAEACSGIRSLVTLLTLGLVSGYFADTRWSIRAAIVISAVPVAIICNGARVAGTGIAAHFYGAEVAEGFFHSFSGWFLFVIAFLLICAWQAFLLRAFSGPGMREASA